MRNTPYPIDHISSAHSKHALQKHPGFPQDDFDSNLGDFNRQTINFMTGFVEAMSGIKSTEDRVTV